MNHAAAKGRSYIVQVNARRTDGDVNRGCTLIAIHQLVDQGDGRVSQQVHFPIASNQKFSHVSSAFCIAYESLPENRSNDGTVQL
jgi:hypothetical protein